MSLFTPQSISLETGQTNNKFKVKKRKGICLWFSGAPRETNCGHCKTIQRDRDINLQTTDTDT